MGNSGSRQEVAQESPRHLADPEINAQVILESAGQHPQKPEGLWGEWEAGRGLEDFKMLSRKVHLGWSGAPEERGGPPLHFLRKESPILAYISIFSGCKKGSMGARIRVYGRVCLIHSLHGPELALEG